MLLIPPCEQSDHLLHVGDVLGLSKNCATIAVAKTLEQKVAFMISDRWDSYWLIVNSHSESSTQSNHNSRKKNIVSSREVESPNDHDSGTLSPILGVLHP